MGMLLRLHRQNTVESKPVEVINQVGEIQPEITFVEDNAIATDEPKKRGRKPKLFVETEE